MGSQSLSFDTAVKRAYCLSARTGVGKMDLNDALQVAQKVVSNPLFLTILTLVLTPLIATHFSLRAFRLQSKELLDAAITWQWDYELGPMTEEPFLAIQNRSSVPAFLVQARLLKGVLIRTEAARYAFSYPDVTDGNFPLQVSADGVTSFPLAKSIADKAVLAAPLHSRMSGFLLRRPYLWLEVRTISGHRLVVSANDMTSFQTRPLWLQGRWFPAPTPEWMKPKKLKE